MLLTHSRARQRNLKLILLIDRIRLEPVCYCWHLQTHEPLEGVRNLPGNSVLECGGRILGLNRNTLRKKINELDIEIIKKVKS